MNAYSLPAPGTFIRFQRLRVVFLLRKHLQVSFKVGDEWSTFVVSMYIEGLNRVLAFTVIG